MRTRNSLPKVKRIPPSKQSTVEVIEEGLTALDGSKVRRIRAKNGKIYNQRLDAKGKVIAGRHAQRVVIPQDQFEKLCAMHSPQKEITGFFHTSIENLIAHLTDWYAEEMGDDFSYENVVERFQASGKISLRQAQMENAIKKNNVVMQIWLGKQILGQSEMPNGGVNADDTKTEYDIRDSLYAQEAEKICKEYLQP